MSKNERNIKLEENRKMSQNIFDVPDGYFDQLQNDLESRMDFENSKLNTLKSLSHSPFTTPKGFFESLENSILSKTIDREPKVIPLFNRTWVRVTAIAASLALISAFYFTLPNPTISESERLSNISNEVIIDFLHAEETTEDDLYDELESFDTILEDMISEELTAFADILSSNSELNYHFEYFEQ